MKPIASVFLLLSLTAVSGQSKNPRNSVEQILIQLEHDWSDADLHKDSGALSRILADDWIGIDFEGTVLNKLQALQGIASDSGSLESTVLRDMKVRVYGDTAVVTGTDTETGDYHGKDSSGRYMWTDVFVRRGGRWQAVSSQSTRLTAPQGQTFLAKLSAAPKHVE
jgi:ketosteroid isomerase-like protein